MKYTTKDELLLTEALYLAITAPTDDHAERAVELAEHFACALTPLQVERCKEIALGRVQDEQSEICWSDWMDVDLDQPFKDDEYNSLGEVS